ncbi:Ig-like domain-containing protein, partial [Campylobacter suis]|uniref:Ig-like domain-containing protein n=1 Tax=Campylobacter suis TaxID=2790657 RepID=UPI001E4E66FA
GVVTIPEDKVKDNTPVTTTTTDDAGNKSPVGTATAGEAPDTTPPVVSITSVINEDTDMPADGTPNSTKVTFTVDDPTATIEVTGPNGETPDSIVENPDGSKTATFNTPLPKDSEVTVTATDEAGNEGRDSDIVPATTFADNEAPTVDVVANRDGSVSITPANDGKTMTVSYIDNDDVTHTATYTNNNGTWTRISGDTTFPRRTTGSITLKADDVKDGTEVSATIADVAGNVGSDKDTALTPLTAPTITYEEDQDKNNIVTRQESIADGSVNKTAATVAIPSGAIEGDILTITNNRGEVVGKYTVGVDANTSELTLIPDANTAANDANTVNGSTVEIPLTFDVNARNNTLNITAEISDGSQRRSDKKNISLEKLGDMSISIFEGDYEITELDWQNGGATKEQAESDGDINNATARIRLPENMVTGDVIKIIVDDNFKKEKVEIEVEVTKNSDNTFSFTETTNTGKVGNVENVAVENGVVSIDVKEIPTHSRDEAAPVVKGGYATQVTVELAGQGGEVRTTKVEHQIMKEMNEMTISYDEAGSDNVLSISENQADGDLTKSNVTINLPYAAKVGNTVTVEFSIDGNVVETQTLTIDADMKQADQIVLEAPVEGGKTAAAKATFANMTASAEIDVEAADPIPGRVVVDFADDVIAEGFFKDYTRAENAINQSESIRTGSDTDTMVKFHLPRNDVKAGYKLVFTAVDTDGTETSVTHTITEAEVSARFVSLNVGLGSVKEGNYLSILDAHLINRNDESGEKVSSKILVDRGTEIAIDDIQVTSGSTTIIGFAEPNSTFAISVGGNVVSNSTISQDANGKFSITIPTTMQDGGNINIKATDIHYNTSNTSIDYNQFVDVSAAKGVFGGDTSSTTFNEKMSDGDNFIKVTDRIRQGADITTQDGNDIVVVDNWINSGAKIDLGNGNNKLSVGTNIDSATVIAGDGNDIVVVDNWINSGAKIDLGNGNNKLSVGTNIDSATVIA